MGSEFVILGFKDERYYGVDGVAARVWELVQKPQTLDSIVDTIVSEFEIDRETCTEDVRALVEDLADRAMVSVSPVNARA